MARSIEYAVYRVGSNAANQGMRERLLVDVITAASREAAKAECAVHCYANQRLEAVPVSRVSSEDLEEYYEEKARDDANARYAEKHAK